MLSCFLACFARLISISFQLKGAREGEPVLHESLL